MLHKGFPRFFHAIGKRTLGVFGKGKELIAIGKQLFRVGSKRLIRLTLKCANKVFGSFPLAVKMIEREAHTMIPEFVFFRLFVSNAFEHANRCFVVFWVIFFCG